MAIKVVSFAGYLADISVNWRGQDHDAHDFVKGLKGESFKGYADVKVRGVWRRLNGSNLDRAIDWFGQFAADYLHAENRKWPIALVPVPNSRSVTGGPEPRTLLLAQAVSKHLEKDSSVVDLFRWKKPSASAHKGHGSRNAAVLLDNLRTVSPLPNEPIVIIDDVLTSGGHIQACAAFLKIMNRRVAIAICGGRTVYSQNPDPFAVATEELEEFNPAKKSN